MAELSVASRLFAATLVEDPERLARSFVSHLSRYATGVEPTYADRATIRDIVRSVQEKQYGVRSLLHAFVQSRMFSMLPPLVVDEN